METTESRVVVVGGVGSTSIVSSLEDVSGSCDVFGAVPFDASLPLVMTTSSLSFVSLKSTVAGVDALLSGDEDLKVEDDNEEGLGSSQHGLSFLNLDVAAKNDSATNSSNFQHYYNFVTFEGCLPIMRFCFEPAYFAFPQ